MRVRKYLVNKEKGVCTCVISDCKYDAIDEIKRMFGYSGTLLLIPMTKRYILNTKYVGIARCAPEDEFDENIGKKLAYERAVNLYRKDKKRIADMVCKNTIERIGKVEKHFSRYSNL